jgi:hypothetical protein
MIATNGGAGQASVSPVRATSSTATTPSAVDAPAGPARPTGAPLADEPPSSVTPTPSNASGSAFRGGDDRRRLAYADPPYPGQATRYRNGSEVNHRLLIEHLRTFDGWALSTSASALRDVWNLCPEARCAAWAKTYAVNGWSRVRWSWEPVLFVTDRAGLCPGQMSTAWDALFCAPMAKPPAGWQEVPGKGGGAKPPAFARWVAALLDYDPATDELLDLFPGSGSFGRAVDIETPDLFESADG